MNSNKFKTVLCKHFSQSGSCSYGDKCQFAHGFQELQNPSTIVGNLNTSISSLSTDNSKVKNIPNPSNFKIVKCKNWEMTGTCSYGSVCTFAHGEHELRTKVDNSQVMTSNYDPNMNMMMQMQQDPSFFYNMMMQQQMMMNMYGMGQMNQGMNCFPQQEYSQFPNVNYSDNNMNINDMNGYNYQGFMNMNNEDSSFNNMYMGGKP